MEPLVIDQTQNTPYINLDKENNEFVFKGMSLPENSNEFYKPVLDWLNEYFRDPNPETRLTFIFDYINTSSSKTLTNILKIFEKQHAFGTKVSVSWKFQPDDVEMLEFAEEMKHIIRVPINISTVEQE